MNEIIEEAVEQDSPLKGNIVNHATEINYDMISNYRLERSEMFSNRDHSNRRLVTTGKTNRRRVDIIRTLNKKQNYSSNTSQQSLLMYMPHVGMITSESKKRYGNYYSNRSNTRKQIDCGSFISSPQAQNSPSCKSGGYSQIKKNLHSKYQRMQNQDLSLVSTQNELNIQDQTQLPQANLKYEDLISQRQSSQSTHKKYQMLYESYDTQNSENMNSVRKRRPKSGNPYSLNMLLKRQSFKCNYEKRQSKLEKNMSLKENNFVQPQSALSNIKPNKRMESMNSVHLNNIQGEYLQEHTNSYIKSIKDMGVSTSSQYNQNISQRVSVLKEIKGNLNTTQQEINEMNNRMHNTVHQLFNQRKKKENKIKNILQNSKYKDLRQKILQKQIKVKKQLNNSNDDLINSISNLIQRRQKSIERRDKALYEKSQVFLESSMSKQNLCQLGNENYNVKASRMQQKVQALDKQIQQMRENGYQQDVIEINKLINQMQMKEVQQRKQDNLQIKKQIQQMENKIKNL